MLTIITSIFISTIYSLASTRRRQNRSEKSIKGATCKAQTKNSNICLIHCFQFTKITDHPPPTTYFLKGQTRDREFLDKLSTTSISPSDRSSTSPPYDADHSVIGRASTHRVMDTVAMRVASMKIGFS